MKKSLLISILSLLAITVFAQEKQYKIACIAFYNLENLFDTIIDPNPDRILQADFTPNSHKNWNTERYYRKLDNMARVISEIGTDMTPNGPAIIGVSEVENRLVLEDLVKRPAIASRNYQIVHYESPDERGIDVALLYQPGMFKVISSAAHSILLPENNRTRDLLVVKGVFDGEEIYVMVDHWPSRGGGQKKSAPLRNMVAQHDRGIIDSVFELNPDAKIVFMGDLNDDPTDESVEKFLNANGNIKKLKEGQLYNTMYKKFRKGIGTLAYQNNWNLFDQIIISQSFLNKDKSKYQFYKSFIFNKKYLVEKQGNYKGYPLRTYAGGEYKGGYSDHFPSYIFIIKEIN